jgi:NAD(P)H-dependent FMN reductase
VKIVAIDASPTRGVVSLTVEAAARSAERSEASVQRVRLAELKILSCTGCGMCRYGEGCKIDDDLPALAELIAEADGVILGLPAYFRRPDPALKRMIERLQRFFPRDGQLVLPGLNAHSPLGSPGAQRATRAVIITASKAPEPLATFFGYTTGPIRELRSALGAGGIRTVGSLALTGGWLRESFDEWEHDRATSLGRMLAGRV